RMFNRLIRRRPASATASRQDVAFPLLSIPDGAPPGAPAGSPSGMPPDAATLRDRLMHLGAGVNRVSSPDLLAQLQQGANLKPDTLICCAIDSDPDAPLNASVARAFREQVIGGITILARALGIPDRILVAADGADLPADGEPADAEHGFSVM